MWHGILAWIGLRWGKCLCFLPFIVFKIKTLSLRPNLPFSSQFVILPFSDSKRMQFIDLLQQCQALWQSVCTYASIKCGTKKQYHIGPYSEVAATIIATVQLKWEAHHLLPHLLLLVQKSLQCSCGMDAFSEFKRLHQSCRGHFQPVHLAHLTSLSSRWQLFVWNFIWNCLFLECWCFSFISHFPVTWVFHWVPFFILFSCSCIWVFSSFIFFVDPVTKLLVIEKNLIK